MLRIEIICHATEDWDLIEKKASELFGLEFSKKVLKGHWGNPILFLTARASGSNEKGILEKLPLRSQDQDSIKLSKEALVSGRLSEGEGIFLKWDKHKF